MKMKLQLTGICVLVFVLTIAFAFLLFFNFLNIFVNFDLLTSNNAVFIACGLSGACAVIVLIITICKISLSRSTKFGNWLSQHYPKMILCYIVLSCIFVSIKNEIYLSFDSIKDLISVEWTILGISVTIFLVWNVVILQFLKKQIPEKSSKMYLFQKRNYIEQKGTFYELASLMFNSISLLIFNVFVLIIATCAVYIILNENLILVQNFAIVSFYFCTNTLVCLFLDIIKPIMQEKREMLKVAKVTNKEVEEKNKIDEELKKIVIVIQEIDKLENIEDDAKLQMKKELLGKVFGGTELLDTTEDTNKDDQL